MPIDINKWNKKVQSEVKDKNIRFELNKKFQGEHKTLTEEQAQAIFDDMTKNEAQASKGSTEKMTKNEVQASKGSTEKMNLQKWNEIVDKAGDKGEISRVIQLKLNEKFKGEHETLTEEQAQAIFDDMKKNNISPIATTFMNIVRDKFFDQRGPQRQRLLDKINNGEIQTQEDFDKAMEIEKKDLIDQGNKTAALKQSIRDNINKEIAEIKQVKVREAYGVKDERGKFEIVDLSYFIADVQKLEEIRYGLENFALYDTVKARRAGKSEDEILKDVEKTYNFQIQEIKNYILNKAKAYDFVIPIISMLIKNGESEIKSGVVELDATGKPKEDPPSTALAKDVERVLNEMGPVKALEMAERELPKLQSAAKKDLTTTEQKLKKAQIDVGKAAKKNKTQIIVLSPKVHTNILQNGFLSYMSMIDHISNNYCRKKLKMVLNDTKGNDAEKKRGIIKKQFGNGNFGVFMDKADYDEFIQNPTKYKMISAKGVFNLEDNSALQNTKTYINNISNIQSKMKTIKIKVKISE